MKDVIIVGAGPAGSGAALELARVGRKVAVVDYRQTPGDKLCTGIVSVDCLRDFPPTRDVVYRHTSAATVVAPSGKRLLLPKDGPQACVTDRIAYVSDLAEQAQDAGAEYHLGCRVTDIRRGADGVEVVLDGQNGRRPLMGKMAVVATGFGTPLAASLGLARSQDFVLAAQVEVLAPDVDGIEVYLGQDVAPGFFAWLVPTAPGRALLGLLSRTAPLEHLRRLAKSLNKAGKVAMELAVPRCWGVPLQAVESSVADRAVLVGDAAGQVKPTTGGGIYYALLSSRVAARAIHSALEAGCLSAASLARYEVAWRALLGKELQAGARVRALAERLKDWQMDQIVSVVGSNGFLKSLLTSSDVSFDWHGKLVQNVLGFPTLVDSIKLLGFSDLWRRLTRVRP